MDEIRELLQNLNQLSAEDLERLRGLIVAKFDEVDKEATTPENVAALNELADAGEQVQAEGKARDDAQAQAEADKEAARQRIAAVNGNAEEEEAEESETPAAEEPETPEGEGENQEAPEGTPAEPVTASAAKPGKVARMAARQSKPKPSPEAAEPQANRTALVASAEMPRFAGTELDRDKLAVALADKLSRMGDRPVGKPGARGRDVIVASADWSNQYPDERIVKEDYGHDTRAWREAFDRDALVATGGICAPVNVDWSINMIATAERPVQAALPAFQANRGGLIYRPDLDFAALEAATGIWTEATDLSPAGATKPIYTVLCPSTDTVFVEAVTTRLGFGNMQSRFDPETVAANTDAALAAYARVADNNLLNLIAAQATQGVTNTQILGATRDLLATLGQVVAAFRNLHRVPDSQALRAIFPAWLKELLRIDLARETAHQQDGQWNSLCISDEQIASLFEPYGVTPIWHLDGQSTTAPGLSGAVNQFFSTQSTGAINTFPTKCAWYLYYEGAIQYLDGGRLDLGIVRDSLLDSTNDYETFVEVFETIAFRGFSGGLIQFVTTLCASGGSAGTINTSASCP
jgi:hypothetical protein